MEDSKKQLIQEYQRIMDEIDTNGRAMMNFIEQGKVDIFEHFLKKRGECINRLEACMNRLIELDDLGE